MLYESISEMPRRTRSMASDIRHVRGAARAEGVALPAADTRRANSRGHMRSRPPSSADSSSGVGCIGSDAAQQQLLRG
eukprot:scaffold40431_cov77-Phaeocystis_antarctica.AAC.2